MIRPEERLWAGSGNLFTGGPYTWHITDLDQRRHFAVTYDPPTPVEDVEETEEICMEQLRRHVDGLGKGIVGIRFSEHDGPITTSTDPADDVTWYVNSWPVTALELPFPIPAISISKLVELDRLATQVDLVSYQKHDSVSGTLSTTKAAFKYWFMENGMFRTWYELNNWSRLPRDHPHIVPFDSVVLDPYRGTIVGFTTIYYPGGNLGDNNCTTRPLQLRWFRQLLSVVDDLNYRYGIMHQDIAPRNLLIDEQDNLRIFDFNYAIMIGEHYTPDRDDIKGVIFTLYELITLDEHYREVPHEQQDAEAVMQLEWTKHPDVKLDSDVRAFRQLLQEWVDKRKTREFEPRDTWVRWPWMPKPPLGRRAIRDENRKFIRAEVMPMRVLPRHDLVDIGEEFWDWERPASYQLRDVLEKGKTNKEDEGATG
ncbi:hypothetical protein ACJ41O_014844 [Fusarium nematophilum]